MASKILGTLSIIVAFSFLSYGLYLNYRIGEFDSMAKEYERLSSLHGPCSNYWNCPTDQMQNLRFDMRSASTRLEGAEDLRDLSYVMTVASPFLVVISGAIINYLFRLVLPIFGVTYKLTKQGVNEASKASAAASQRAISGFANMADSAKGRTKECPFCSEFIKPQAKVCLHCRRDVV